MEIATLLTAFAALLTSVITLFTVKEMRKQRLAAHLPIIKVLSDYIDAELDKEKVWLWEREKLSINNFGKGVALNVEVKWNVNIEAIVALIKKYDPHNIKGFSLDGNLLKLDNSFHAIRIQSEQSFPAISENLNTFNKISIPKYFTAAYATYINESVLNRPKENNLQSFNIEEFPSMNIKVIYSDLDNNRYEKNFSLSLNLVNLNHCSDESNGRASVGFNVKEL